MRGGLLSVIASAFRLRHVVTTQNAEVSEGTAKHGLNDHHDIGLPSHRALLTHLVDELFTAAYLEARGLDELESKKHNQLVTAALDALLARWDQLAVFRNVLPEHFERHAPIVARASDLSIDWQVRLCAYLNMYGCLHPFLEEIPGWLQASKLRNWWRTIERRAARPIKVSLLGERGSLDSRTTRAIRDGKALPSEGTVALLAQRLAEHTVRRVRDDGNATPAEVEFELRVVVAAAEYPGVAKQLASSRNDGWIMRVIGETLDRLPDDVSEDLLRCGTQAEAWSRIEGAVLVRLVGSVAGAVRETDPSRAGSSLAQWYGERAEVLRGQDGRPGADGPEKRLAECFELERALALAAAGAGNSEPPPVRPELAAEMKADKLCDEAIAPWLHLTATEQEARLREAVRICGWLAYPHRCLARHLSNTGKIDEALALYRRAFELNPKNEEGREALVLLLSEPGGLAEVLDLTEKQTSTILRSARAQALLRIGDVLGARELAAEILGEHPRHPPTLRTYAACFRASRDLKRATEHERRADFLERGVATRRGNGL